MRSLVISRFGWGFKQFLWNVQPDLEGRQSGNHLHVYVDIVFFKCRVFPMITSGKVETVLPPTKKTGRCDSGMGRSYNKPPVVGVEVFPPLNDDRFPGEFQHNSHVFFHLHGRIQNGIIGFVGVPWSS